MRQSEVFAFLSSWIVNFIVGFVWYHPKVFGTLWAKGVRLRKEESSFKKRLARLLVFTLVESAILIAVAIYFYSRLQMGFFVLVLGFISALHIANSSFWLLYKPAGYIITGSRTFVFYLIVFGFCKLFLG